MRLHVGGKAGIRRSRDRQWLELTVRCDADAGFGFFNRHARLAQRIDRRVHLARFSTHQFDIAPGNSRSTCVAARLDPVAHHRISSTVQPVFAVDDQVGGTDTLNFGAHIDQQVTQIDDFGLTRRVVEDASALGEACGHQCILRRADRHHRESITAAGKALWCESLHITSRNLDLRAECFQCFKVQVDGAVTDRAATGQRNRGLSRAR